MTEAQASRVLDGRLYSPIQDVVGDNYTTSSRLSMTAGVEYPFVCNGNVREFKNFPSHITNIWDKVNNKATFAEFEDTPEMVANVSFIIDPLVSAQGVVTVRVYVDETVALEFKSDNKVFKGSSEKITSLLTFYTGSETGFDVKNKGVKFTVESSANAELFDPSIEIYRT